MADDRSIRRPLPAPAFPVAVFPPESWPRPASPTFRDPVGTAASGWFLASQQCKRLFLEHFEKYLVEMDALLERLQSTDQLGPLPAAL